MSRQDPALTAEIIQQYKIWRSISKVSEQVHLSKSAVYGTLKRNRIKINHPGGQPGDRNQMCPSNKQIDLTKDLYLAGYSTVEIGQILGIAHSSVNRRLNIAGVPLRNRSESARLVAERRRARSGRAWGGTKHNVETVRTDVSGVTTVLPVEEPT